MAEHTLRGNDTILPSMPRETELLVGLNVLNDRVSIRFHLHLRLLRCLFLWGKG